MGEGRGGSDVKIEEDEGRGRGNPSSISATEKKLPPTMSQRVMATHAASPAAFDADTRLISQRRHPVWLHNH